jgi:hypothetical protein
MIFKKSKRKDRYRIEIHEEELEQEYNKKKETHRPVFKMSGDDLAEENKQSKRVEMSNISKAKVRKSCSICLQEIERDEGVFICNYCGTAIHHSCMNYGSHKIKMCPNCKRKIDS